MMMSVSHTRTRSLVMIAMCAILIALCSWISIPVGLQPFTLQTFGVFCTLLLLGGRRGTTAIVVYLLLGMVGLPVFAGFAGGVGVLMGTTGGYLVGFLLTGLCYWLFTRVFGEGRAVAPAALTLGLVLCYAFGTAWFMVVYARGAGEIGLLTALGWCVFPFVIPDAVKLLCAVLLSQRVKKALPQYF